MPLFPFILLGLILFAVVAGFGYVRFAKPVNMLDQLTDATAVEIRVAREYGFEEKPATGFASLLEQLGTFLPTSPSELALKRRELMAAGFRAGYAANVFLGIKVIACMVLLMCGLFLRTYIDAQGLNRLLIPVASAAAGFLVPGWILSRLIQARREKIRMALPDVLDLLVISTEAGCALDKAMVNITREFKGFHPVIADELALVNMEMLAGRSRVEALRNFAARTGEEELKKLVAILAQTDRFGTSVADALRTQSEAMRVQRKHRAEERAGKVGVKLVFPIFFFCMPTLLVIVAGPGLLQLFKNLLPALGSLE
jgi:tight adherence protein C